MNDVSYDDVAESRDSAVGEAQDLSNGQYRPASDLPVTSFNTEMGRPDQAPGF